MKLITKVWIGSGMLYILSVDDTSFDTSLLRVLISLIFAFYYFIDVSIDLYNLYKYLKEEGEL